MKRRIIALAVALFMVLTMVPMTGNAAYAASGQTDVQVKDSWSYKEYESNNSTDTANIIKNEYIVYGTAMPGSPNPDEDWYTFELAKKSIVNIAIVSKSTNTQVTLTPDGKNALKDAWTTTYNSSGSNYTGSIQTVTLAAGQYYLLVKDYNPPTGGVEYNFMFSYKEDTSAGDDNTGGDDVTTPDTPATCDHTKDINNPALKKEVRQEATCTQQGITRVWCACGKQGKDFLVDKKEHEYKQELKEVKKAATCTEEGYAYIWCECKTVYEKETIPSLGGHKEVTVPAVAATCKSTGLTEGKKCEVCGTVTVKQTTVEKTGHAEVSFDEVAATCTEAGIKAGTKCKDCGTVISGGETIKALGHNEVEFAGYAATCEKAGLTAGHKCDRCNKYYSDVKSIAKLEHDIVVDKAVEVTCTKDGKTEGKHCYLCNKVFVAQEVIKASGHKEVVDAGYAATCTTAGLTDGKHCTVCSKVTVEQTVIKASGHKEVVDAAVAATCTTDGVTEGKHCGNCNAVLVAQNVVYAFGHREVANVETAATKDAAGFVVTTCETCNEVTNEKVVPMIGTVKLGTTKYVYNGKVRTPKVTINDVNGNPIDAANYTIKTPTGRKNTGKYTYTVTFKNEYSGKVTLTMQIAPKAPVAKAPAAVKKGATVKWNKVAGNITGYEVMVATNKAFTKGKKTVTVKGAKVVSKKVTGLKAKTKYWVKVRAYKTAGGQKIYSSWSAVKTIKTK